MKILLIIVLSFLYSANLKAQTVESLDCSRFKVGTFHMTNEFSGHTVIKRNNHYQIEKNDKLETRIKLSIEWVNECTYKLVFVKGKNKGKIDYKFAKIPLIVKIISIDGNSYTQISHFQGYDEEYKNVIVKKSK